MRYHNALGGARSKRHVAGGHVSQMDTTMPLGGRDQNGCLAMEYRTSEIPQCPWGGEIKTDPVKRTKLWVRYHNALGGARSKRYQYFRAFRRGDTTMPLGGRDQNKADVEAEKERQIPQCPWGGEIKTSTQKPCLLHIDTTMPLGGRDQNGRLDMGRRPPLIPQCPWGGEIKTVWRRLRL